MFKIGSKIQERMASLTMDEIVAEIADVPETPADDPFYKRGFAIGETRSTGSLKSTAGTTSPQAKNSSPGQKECSTKPQGWTEEDFKKGEEALANLMKQNPPRILSE